MTTENQSFKLFRADIETAVLNLLRQKGYNPTSNIDADIIKSVLESESGYVINVDSTTVRKQNDTWSPNELLNRVRHSLIGLSMYIDFVDETQTEEIVKIALDKISVDSHMMLLNNLKDLRTLSDEVRSFARSLIEVYTAASSRRALKPKTEMLTGDVLMLKTYAVFSVSTNNCFRNAEIFTIADLLEFMKDDTCDILKLKHFGAMSMNEVLGFLRLYNIYK